MRLSSCCARTLARESHRRFLPVLVVITPARAQTTHAMSSQMNLIPLDRGKRVHSLESSPVLMLPEEHNRRQAGSQGSRTQQYLSGQVSRFIVDGMEVTAASDSQWAQFATSLCHWGNLGSPGFCGLVFDYDGLLLLIIKYNIFSTPMSF